VDRHELAALLQPRFDVLDLVSVTPTYNRGPLHLINSRTLQRRAAGAGLEHLVIRFKRWEERRFLGWSLLALARKRPEPGPR
jgi:hypothetical protein